MTLADTKSEFVGRVVLVTGGLSGIGLAAAQAFQQLGATVVATTRNKATAQTFNQRQLESLSGCSSRPDKPIDAQVSDVTELAQHIKLYQYIEQKYGRLDILCPNAGIGFWNNFIREHDGAVVIEKTSPEHLAAQLATNFSGFVHTIEQGSDLLKKTALKCCQADEPLPRIVVVGSVAGYKGLANMPVYAATKAAQRSFTRSYAAQLMASGVKVNVVSPGGAETSFWGKIGCDSFYDQSTDNIITGEDAAAAVGEYFIQATPEGRFAQADEVAKAIVYLASTNCAFMDGGELIVDGGFNQL